MQRFRVWWNSFKTVAILLSFVLNFVAIIVLLLVLMQLFQIKNGILEPLIDGLHRNFVGLDEAVIVRTIEVNDQIPVTFDLPLNQTTNVVLTDDVPIAANATFTLPGGGGVINGRVDITLPQGLVLPVQLEMTVPVDTDIPIHLPVDVEIPLNETQLHDPFVNLRNLLEPYVNLLDHLPDDWSEVPGYTIDAIQGEEENPFLPSEESQDPWPGFSTGVKESRASFNAQGTPVTPTMTFTPYPTLTPATPPTIVPFQTPTPNEDE